MNERLAGLDDILELLIEQGYSADKDSLFKAYINSLSDDVRKAAAFEFGEETIKKQIDTFLNSKIQFEEEEIDASQFFYEDENGKDHFDYKKFSDFLSGKYTFKTTEDNETVFVYNSNFFHPTGEMVIKRESEKILKGAARNQLIVEVIGHIKRSTYMDRMKFNNEKNLVSMENGVFDLDKKEFKPNRPEFLLTYKLPIKYDVNADCPKIKEFLSQILYPQDIPFIQEWFGFCLYRDYFIKAMFVAFGGTDAGKTTLFNLFERFIGTENISHKSLQELTYDRFAQANLYNKHLNMRDDLPDEEINNTGLIKQLTGESPISAQEKHKSSFDFLNFAKMMFAANKLPEVRGDDAFWNRANGLITFPYKFVDQPNPDNMNEKQKRPKADIEKEIYSEEEISGLFNWVLEGYYRLRTNNRFTGTKSSEDAEKFWNLNSSPVAAFCEERIYLESANELDKKELYKLYVDFSNEKRLAALGYETFCRRIIGHYGSSINEIQSGTDKRVRLWQGIALKTTRKCLKCGFASWLRPDILNCPDCEEIL